ncbi:MAG: 50S ribosomal protein L9 [Phycisphaerales bacterium]
MPRTLKLLLIENVDNTGIVGDVVTVRKGFARNFLLPRNLATEPSDEKVQELASKRAEAQKELAELRKHREQVTAKLNGFELTMIRSCNDQGILYGAVVQQDICDELAKAGFPGIKQREVRLGQVIKRVDHFEIHVKFDADLDSVIKLNINADRKLDLDRRTGDTPKADAAATDGAAAPADGAPAAAEGKGDKPADKRPDRKPASDRPRSDKPEGDRPSREGRPDREDRPRRGDMIAKFDAASLEVTKGWGKAAAAAGAAPTAGGDAPKAAKGADKGEKKSEKKGDGKGKKGK